MAPEELPKELVLIGIEGAAFGLGEDLSPAVRAAIPQAIETLNQALRGYTGLWGRLRRMFLQVMGRF